MRSKFRLPMESNSTNDVIKLLGVNSHNHFNVTGLNLEELWEIDIRNALVITGPGAELAVQSAQDWHLEVDLIESHDLTGSIPIKYRDSIEIQNIMSPTDTDQPSWHHQIRLMNHLLDYREVTRVFDHMSAWYHVITRTQRATIVLESTARLDYPLYTHLPRNSIIGLDTKLKWLDHNRNYRVMPGVWAYSIDQCSARRMFNRVLEQGIRENLELMFRADQQLIVLDSRAHRV